MSVCWSRQLTTWRQHVRLSEADTGQHNTGVYDADFSVIYVSDVVCVFFFFLQVGILRERVFSMQCSEVNAQCTDVTLC